MMALDKSWGIATLITIHPEEDIDAFTKFHGNSATS